MPAKILIQQELRGNVEALSRPHLHEKGRSTLFASKGSESIRSWTERTRGATALGHMRALGTVIMLPTNNAHRSEVTWTSVTQIC